MAVSKENDRETVTEKISGTHRQKKKIFRVYKEKF